MRRAIGLVAVALLLAGVGSSSLLSERLPVTVFTTAEGMAGDTVTALLQDRTGLLWVGTSSGLSRFDGQAFTNYGTADGLVGGWIAKLVEDRHGTLWVLSGDSVVRMLDRREADGRLFRRCELAGDEVRPAVFDLLEDGRGELWLTAGKSLYRYVAVRDRFERVPLAIEWPREGPTALVALADGNDGSLWIRSSHGLVRRLPDGRVGFYDVPRGAMDPNAGVLERDGGGRLWLTGERVIAFFPEAVAPDGPVGYPLSRILRAAPDWSEARRPTAPGEAVAFEPVSRLGPERIHGILVARDGSLWIAGDRLFAAESATLRTLDHRHGIPGHSVSSLLEDRDGSLWLATESGGLARLDRAGMVRWGPDEGLATPKAGSVVSDHEGGIVVVSFPACEAVHRLSGDRFEAFRLAVPQAVESCGWGENQVTLVDRFGEWWVPTFNGVLRYPRVRRLEDLPRTPPRARYTMADGLGYDAAFRLFEDARSDIWVSMFSPRRSRLARFDRQRERWTSFEAQEGLPYDTATAFADGRDGSVWMGFFSVRDGSQGGVARYRDGRFRYFAPSADGLPAGFVSSLLVDRRGGLWAGVLGRGLARLEAPDRDPPVWKRYGTAEGLASDEIVALASDRFGQVYIGSRRGVDRLDPESGRVRHFDRASGLANEGVVSMTVDGAGDLWIATAGGVSRLRPRPEMPTSAPPMRLFELWVAGRRRPLPERGLAQLSDLELSASDRHVEVSFAAVDLRPGHRLTYQYRLNEGSWISLAAGERRVHLAGLAPGAYAIEARAMLADGRSGEPATLGFTVEPPFWRRLWFQVALLLVVGGLVLGAVRQRLARLREVQAVRARIAADLHDDLGLSLSRVAMLAEMTRPELAPGSAADTALEEIAASARELVDATSDVAWALDPAKDDLPSLLGRLRRLGGEICEGAGVDFRFCAPEAGTGIVLKDERRRHLYLILKEAVHNAVRHGCPTHLALSVRLEGRQLFAEVIDDGCGFDPELVAQEGGGHGLASLERRAEQLGGTIRVESRPGAGTTVRLEVPLATA